MGATLVGKLPPLHAAVAFFQALKVQDKGGTGMVPLDLNDEQREIIQALYTLSYLVVLKARQVGISTAIAAFVLLAASATTTCRASSSPTTGTTRRGC
jgi:hypothetical protein